MTSRQPVSDKREATPAKPDIPDGDRKPLPAAAQRALAEAEARRAAYDVKAAGLKRAAESGGPKGPEPVRYGDWEKKGIASDF